ncbi:molybdopterin biosynthesis protein MoeB [Pirellulimonas nuda]|uniref:Molybdopterin biosynthesis protein MoeB n=1 Tax=Pirellulimonas nuda TaxID=2528009 RepID=A0A518DAG2_9BACT|nr:rhodanese-like domain-containing protein [Pirellulimonas nuda]QDU88477.1 molybdopterin biosynthesis protein MoeB [Pirellulimonas nuda]
MRTVTPQGLKDMQDAGQKFVLVNTLPADHFEQTKIVGAVNIPESDSDFVDRVKKQAGNKHETVVVYCANSDCDSSTRGARMLEDAGFTHVIDFESGADGWKNAGLQETVSA